MSANAQRASISDHRIPADLLAVLRAAEDSVEQTTVAHAIVDHLRDVGIDVDPLAAVPDLVEQAKEARATRAAFEAIDSALCEVDLMAELKQWIVTDQQVEQMEETKIIWRGLVAQTHLQIYSAPGNGGKTTLSKFAAGELAGRGFKVLYFQEDASAGDLPEMHDHAKAHGYVLLNSTLSGSNPAAQIDHLRNLVARRANLKEHVFFFDTLKKYLDLMSKGGAKEFFQLMRALTQMGGTVILLGHTNKHVGQDGKLVFEGVGDVRNDCDELFYITASDDPASGVVTMTVEPDKVRCAVRAATFTLNKRTREVRQLEHVIDLNELARRKQQIEDDLPIIAAIWGALEPGSVSQRQVIEKVKLGGFGDRSVRRAINNYASVDPNDRLAFWIETDARINNARLLRRASNVPPLPHERIGRTGQTEAKVTR